MARSSLFLGSLLFLIQSAACLADTATVTIAAVGHIVMGTSYPPTKQSLPPDEGKTLFDSTREALTSADITLGNLAAPLSDRGSTHKKVDNVGVFAFRTPAAYARLLKDAGFHVVQAANNHILDFGMEAYQDTLKNLDLVGIGHIGRKDEFFIKDVRGIRVAVMGFTQPYNDRFASHHDIPLAVHSVKLAKSKADVVVVSFHGGTEGKDSLHTPRGPEYLGREYRGDVVRMARALVDAGADVVVGFGPHLPRAMEIYNGKLINYSLGNFLTYGPFNLKGPSGLSLILFATFDKNANMVGAKVLPLKITPPGIPEFDLTGETIKHLISISKEDFPESAPEILNDGTVVLRSNTLR